MSANYADILAELRQLELGGFYERDMTHLESRDDRELAGIFAVADALRDLRSRNYATRIFRTGLGVWEGPEAAGYAAFAAACEMLGLSCLRLERLTESNLVAAGPDVVCARGEFGTLGEELYRSGALTQRPLALPRETALPYVLRLIHRSGGAQGLWGAALPDPPSIPEDLDALRQRFGLTRGWEPMGREEHLAAEGLRPYVLGAMILLGKCPESAALLARLQRQGLARRII